MADEKSAHRSTARQQQKNHLEGTVQSSPGFLEELASRVYE
jgi:hypothetical protein